MSPCSAESAAAVIGHEQQQQVEKLEAAVEEGKQREGQMVQKKTVSSLLHHTVHCKGLYTAKEFYVYTTVHVYTTARCSPPQSAIARAALPDVLHPCTLLGSAARMLPPAGSSPLEAMNFVRVRLAGSSSA